MAGVSFEQYKEWIVKYIVRWNDTREINFQYGVVKPLLENVFADCDIVGVDAKRRESKAHDYSAYCGTYKNSKGKEVPTTPDLLICKNWNWFSKDNDKIKYIATVEVKSPCAKGAIHNKTYEQYTSYAKLQIDRHLSAKKIDKLILTDTLKWEFYVSGSEKPYKSIALADESALTSDFELKWKDNAEIVFENLLNELIAFIEK